MILSHPPTLPGHWWGKRKGKGERASYLARPGSKKVCLNTFSHSDQPYLMPHCQGVTGTLGAGSIFEEREDFLHFSSGYLFKAGHTGKPENCYIFYYKLPWNGLQLSGWKFSNKSNRISFLNDSFEGYLHSLVSSLFDSMSFSFSPTKKHYWRFNNYIDWVW